MAKETTGNGFGWGRHPEDDPRSARLFVSPHAVDRMNERLGFMLSDNARDRYAEGVHFPTIVETFKLLIAATPAKPDRFAARGLRVRSPSRRLFVNGRAVLVADLDEDRPWGRTLVVVTALDLKRLGRREPPDRTAAALAAWAG